MLNSNEENECSDFSDIVQTLFRQCSECSVMFRLCSESVQTLFRICSEFSVMFRLCSDSVQNVRECSDSVQNF